MGGAAGGATSAALNGGGVKDVLKGAVMGGIRGAVSAGITYGVAEVAGGLSGENFHGLGGKLGSAIKDGSYGAKELALHAAKITSNGISGGITSEIFGGDFIDGMAGGAVSAAFSPISSGMFHDGNVVGAFGVAGLSGGLGSLAVGGNFESGAIAGVFNFAFNELAGSSERSRNRKLSYGKPRGPSMFDRVMSRAWSNSKMVGNAFMEDPGAILGAAWEGGKMGNMAFWDGVNPFGNQFQSAGYYDRNMYGLKYSQYIGVATREIQLSVTATRFAVYLYKSQEAAHGMYTAYKNLNMPMQILMNRITLSKVSGIVFNTTGFKKLDVMVDGAMTGFQVQSMYDSGKTAVNIYNEDIVPLFGN